VKGLVILRKGTTTTAQDILTFANGKLAGYKRLYTVAEIDSIPKTASGKILRRELAEREKQKLG
jgi:long-chain acyl-CoA synthetase